MAATLVKLREEERELTDDTVHTPCSWAPNNWFSEHFEVRRQAIKICQKGCSVRMRCLELAMDLEKKNGSSRFGIWGGLNPHQRQELARVRREMTPDVTDVPIH